MINILFTGVGRRIELIQAFRNAALVLNKEVNIFGADMAGTAPALVNCDYVRWVVAMKNPSYINNLLRIYSRFDQSVCIEEGKSTQIKGVIFDLDDTLYSEKEYVKSGYEAVSDYLGGGMRISCGSILKLINLL